MNKVISIRFKEEDWKAIVQIAEQQRVAAVDIVRMTVVNMLNARTKHKTPKEKQA